VTPVVSNLLSLLAENARLGRFLFLLLDLLDSIANKFDDLISAAAGHVSVSVTSAQVSTLFSYNSRLIKQR
jgi:F0F1-type ATP synthase delta subunit